MNQPEETLDERSKTVLRQLVDVYLSEGHPVASKQLARDPAIAVSSATVRNIMADLEDRGLIASPHTSAGRIPTAAGLRLFIDTLISVQPLNQQAVAQLRGELNPDLSPKQLVESASHLLSHVTHMAGLVMLPRREVTALRHVEFLPLSGQRVLVVLVINEREVENRVIHTDREYSEAELTAAANYIVEEFGGRPLSDIHRGVVESMRADRDRIDAMMAATIDIASKAFDSDNEPVEDDVVLAGERNLLELTDGSGMLTLLDAFNRKRDILHLLDRCLRSDGVQLFIGDESGYAMFDEYTVVSAKYEVDGSIAGALGVIGPTRMNYREVIPIVDATAKVLSAALRY